MFRIGPYRIANQTVLAPMAGISDQPFRSICSSLGAGMVVGEMVTSDTGLWHSQKSRSRLTWSSQNDVKVVQIAGSVPEQMAQAAQKAVLDGANIIDINMGCPAKKVCNKAAGSALLQDESLVQAILSAVVKAVDVPVTLKYRTGWSPSERNAVKIAQIAEQLGVAALTLHGRTRACRFNGEAEYDTIAQVVKAVNIPVIANGDINSAQKAEQVLAHTRASAVMIGRGAQGNPWIFAQINAFLADGTYINAPTCGEVYRTVTMHLQKLHDLYGEFMGVRFARKHVAWYVAKHYTGISSVDVVDWRKNFNQLTQQKEQFEAVNQLFERLQQLEDHAA